MSLPITTDRLVLRRPVPGDVDGIVAIETDPEVSGETTGIGTTPNAVADYIERQSALEPFQLGKCFDLFLELRDSGLLIGLVSLVHKEPAQGQIGWAIHGDYRNRGYATEAGTALTRYAFQTLGLHRVFADTSINNFASKRVMEKIGLNREGVLREAGKGGDHWHDMLIYGVTADRWDDPGLG